MLKKIKSLFTSNEVKDLYHFPTIEYSEMEKFPNLLRDIHKRKIDGIIIKNVFSQQEVETMRGGIKTLPNELRNPILGGDVFPKIFAQVVLQKFENSSEREKFLEDYFKNSAEINANYSKLIGIDFTSRLENVFSMVSGSRKITIPYGMNYIGQYANATIRRYFPKEGFISVHSGNYFQKEFEGFYQHLAKQVDITNQLSYFVTINRAEKGGELTLFDLEWKDAQSKASRTEDQYVQRLDGTSADVRKKGNVKRQYVNPPEGALLLFAGGEIWHRVEPIIGNQSRITIAGFMGFSYDDKEILYWS